MGRREEPTDDVVRWSERAEQSLLASIMCDPDKFLVVDGIAEEADLYSERHRAIYHAVRAVYERSGVVSMETLAEELRLTRKMDAIGGPDYLVTVLDSSSSGVHTVHWANIVRNFSQKRQVERALMVGLDAVRRSGPTTSGRSETG